MSTKFVSVGRNQPLLVPPDLRDRIPEDDLVHFVTEAVEGLDLRVFRVDARGSGSAQYPPHMMLASLIYCYANGVFSSRRHDRAFKVERATYRDIAVRFLTGALLEQLDLEVRALMEQAERSDQSEEADGQSLPEELARRKKLKAKLEATRARIEARAKANARHLKAGRVEPAPRRISGPETEKAPSTTQKPAPKADRNKKAQRLAS